MTTKLRWFQTYDEHGLDSEKVLEYWDDELECWMEVNLIRVAECEVDYRNKEDY